VLAAHGWNVDCSVCRCGPACLVLTTNTSLRTRASEFRVRVGCGGRGTAAGADWWAGERAVGCLRVRTRAAAVLVAGLLLVSCGAGRSVHCRPVGAGRGGGVWSRGGWWWVLCLLVCRLRCSSHPDVVWGWRVAGCCLRTAQWTRASLWPSFLGRMVDALVPGTDEGRGRPR
jgi:hypothetical protein